MTLVAWIGYFVLSVVLPDVLDGVYSLFSVVFFGFVILGVVRTARGLLRRARSRRMSAEIDRRIGEAATGAETDGRALAEKVLRQGGPASAPLVDQRVNRYLADASAARYQAEAEILRHPPLLPRTAKRMLNQLRVMIVVALRRGLLAPDTGVTPVHIGRWLVLQERWPMVSRALVARPNLGMELESQPTAEDLTSGLSSLGITVTDPDCLLSFLQADPRLSPFLDRIVRYSP